MKFKLNVNSKDYIIDAPSNQRLSIVLRDIIGRKSVKHNCGCGRCGFCLILLDNEPIYSCIYPVFKAQNKKIITLEAITQKSEYSNIIKGFELANIDLCPNCAPARILLTYHHLENNRDLSDEIVDQIIESVTCDCTDKKRLKDAIYLAASFYDGGNF